MGSWLSKEEKELSSDSDMSDIDDDSSSNNKTPLHNNKKIVPNPNPNPNLPKNQNQNIKSNFLPKNINPYPDLDFNKNINNISNQSNNLSILGKKHLRSDTENNNNNFNKNNNNNNNYSPNIIKTKKIEAKPLEQSMNANTQINKLNKSVIELIEENKKLKKENEDNKKLIYSQNKKLKDIEKEINIKVKEALNQIKNENNENEKFIREQIKKALEHYKEKNEEKLNSIISEIPNEMEKNLEKKAKELENLYYIQYKTKINKKKNKEIHDGIKCQKCFMEPIVGIRYKCSICKEYNLCENCEKENEETNDHPHIFLKIIKKGQTIPKISYIENDKNEKNQESEANYEEDKIIKKEKEEYNNKYYNNDNNSYIKKNEIIINTDIKEKKSEKINNSMNNNYNNNIFESRINLKKSANFNNYSYECLTKELEFSVYQGTKNAKFNLNLKNNGDYPWPKENSFLICDAHLSDKIVEKIELEPLNPGYEYFASVYFDDLDELGPGKYNTYLDFNVKNKNFGEKILIILEILEKKVKPAYDPKIAEFRNNFKIDEKTLSDEVIRDALNQNNNDIDKAFEYLYQF